MFFLSAQEAENDEYGFTNDAARIADYGVSAGVWWLRSPSANYTNLAGVVYRNGYGSNYYVNYDYAVRPAFNLDLNSVLFTSAAVGGKSANGMDSGLTAIGNYAGNEWKLTLLDKSRSFAVTEQTVSGAPPVSYHLRRLHRGRPPEQMNISLSSLQTATAAPCTMGELHSRTVQTGKWK